MASDIDITQLTEKLQLLKKRGRINEAADLIKNTFQVAVELTQSQRYAEAIAIFSACIEFTKNNPDFYCSQAFFYNLAYCYMQTGDIRSALNVCIQSIELEPINSNAYAIIREIMITYIRDTPDTIAIWRALSQIPTYFSHGPIRVRLESSSACNLRCQHCPTGTKYGQLERNIMSMELFETILGQLKQLPLLKACILYLGGEPLLNKHLCEMSQRLKKETTLDFITLNSNAMLVTPAIAEQLKTSGIDQIEISIDGRSPEENDQFRQGANYQTVKDNVHLLKRLLPNTKISIANTIIKQKSDNIDNAVTPKILLDDFPDIPIETSYAMKWPGFEINHSNIEKLSVQKKPAPRFCQSPFEELSIRANGDIVMCCNDLLSGNIIGNVKSDSILELWKGSYLTALRKNMLEQNIGALPLLCQNCRYYNDEGYLTVS